MKAEQVSKEITMIIELGKVTEETKFPLLTGKVIDQTNPIRFYPM
jgi:hypothetical protein